MITALDKKTALIVIDLQGGVVKALSPTLTGPVVANASRLAAAFRGQGLPVILVNVNPVGAPRTLVRATESSMPKDAAGQAKLLETFRSTGFMDLVPELGKQPTDICITKNTWGAFYNTPLDETLRKNGVTGIVLAGISTSIGVESTARAASERGYNISFAQDALLDRIPAAQENSLKYIFPRIGEVGDTDAIIGLLGKR